MHTPGKIHAGGTVTHQAGRYALYLDQAVGPEGGGVVEVRLGKQTLEAAVVSTGGWKNYQRIKLGELTIAKAGKQTLIMKPLELRQGLMNLKSVELVPVD